VTPTRFKRAYIRGGLSPKLISEKLGIHPSNVSHWAKGDFPIPPRRRAQMLSYWPEVFERGDFEEGA